MQDKQISVEGDAGLVVAGDATHDGATANNQMSNVINIHHHGAAMNDARSLTMEGRMNRMLHCPGCALAQQQQALTRRWLYATTTVAVAALCVSAYSMFAPTAAGDPSVAAQNSLCHHDGKAHSPGGVARMADSQIYICLPPQAGNVATWERVRKPFQDAQGA